MHRLVVVVGSCLALVAGACVAIAATPLSYKRTLRDEQGVSRKIDFRGTADTGRVTGTVTVDGVTMQVVGTIGKTGSISGTLTDETGATVGNFWGAPDGSQVLRGGYSFGATGGDWNAPGFPIPTEAIPTGSGE